MTVWTMKRRTNEIFQNPLERMMMRPPIVRAGFDPAPAPTGHPCYGCKRWNEASGCVLPCYRGVERVPPVAL